MAYGVQKLQISCVVEDDKIGTDFLEEKITEFEDYVSACIVGNWFSICLDLNSPQNVCLVKKYTSESIAQ